MKYFVFLLMLSAQISFGQLQLNVITFNIRLGSVDDGPNHWNIRKEKVLDVLDFYDADFMGLHEAQKFQLDYLLPKLPEYAMLGKPRDSSVNSEYSCILFNKNVFKLIQENTFWLSETPTTTSKSWDAALPRIVTYGLFQHIKSKKKIWILNTHFDHMGKVARENSAKMILEKIQQLQKISNSPVVLMGDLNSRPEDAPNQVLSEKLADTRTICKTKPYGTQDTWQGFEFNKPPNGQIDYIYIEKKSKLTVTKHRTIQDFYDYKYPSDHFPVFCTLIY